MSPPPSTGPRRRRGAVALVVASLAVVLAACGTSGRTMKAPPPGATAPPRSTTTTFGGAALSATGLTLASSAWNAGGPIPSTFTCDGQGASPPMQVAGVPTGTAELMLIVTDPAAKGYVHWAVAGIDPVTAFWAQGTVPNGAVQGRNGAGNVGWAAICPPKGQTHTYDFTLYALGQRSGLADGFDPSSVTALVAGATAQSVLTGTYTRP